MFFHFRCSLERNVPPIESAMSRINFLGIPYLENASRNLSCVSFLLDTLLHPHSILKPHSYLFCLLLPPPARLFELKTAATETSRDHSVSKSTKICKSVVLKWHHFDCITAWPAPRMLRVFVCLSVFTTHEYSKVLRDSLVCLYVFIEILKTEKRQGICVSLAPPGGLNSSWYDTVKPEDISFKVGQEVCVWQKTVPVCVCVHVCVVAR